MYTPNNPNVFNAAYTGCLYGIAENTAAISDVVESDYANPAVIAGAFAQAVDTVWGSVTVANQLDIGIITSACRNYWLRGASPAAQGSYQLASTWSQAAQAIVDLVDAAEAYFTAQGITPLPIPSGGGSVTLTGDVTGTESGGIVPTTIASVNPDPGTWGDATQTAQITVNTKGQVTAISNVNISGVPPAGPAGGVLAGSYPNPSLAATGVTAGTYGSSSQVAQVTVNAGGQVTAASSVIVDATLTGDVTGTGAVTGITTSLGYPVSSVAASGTLTLSRNRLQTAVVTGTGATVNLPSAPVTGDLCNLVLAFTGSGAGTTVTNGGGTANVEPPLVIGTFTASVVLQDSAGIYTYQYNGTNWVLLTSNSTLPTFKGPMSPPDNGSWTVANWYIDELNTSGVASDSNTGTSRTAPLLTKNELARRYGTTEPFINQTTTVLFMSLASAASQATDPWVIKPICGNSGVFIVTSDFSNLAPSFTGTLNTVTPKSNTTSPGNALQSTFTTATGAVATTQLLVNSTRAKSLSFVQKLISSPGNYQLSQPVAAYTAGAFLPVPATEVDTWASGDSVSGYVLPSINVAIAGCTVHDLETGTYGNGIYFQYLTITGTNAASGYDQMVIGPWVIFLFSLIENLFTSLSSVSPDAAGASIFVPRFYSCYLSLNGSGGSFAIQAGAVTMSSGSGRAMFMDDVIWSGNIGDIPSEILFGDAILGHVMIDVSSVFATDGACPHHSQAMLLYGTGAYDSYGATYYGSSTGTNAFRVSTLRLCNTATGYSMLTSAGVTTINGGITLSGPNLDAAAGAAGFGGTATNLAGASITNGTQP